MYIHQNNCRRVDMSRHPVNVSKTIDGHWRCDGYAQNAVAALAVVHGDDCAQTKRRVHREDVDLLAGTIYQTWPELADVAQLIRKLWRDEIEEFDAVLLRDHARGLWSLEVVYWCVDTCAQ